MSNFWANRIAPQQPAQQPAAPRPANAPWWAPAPVQQASVQPQAPVQPVPQQVSVAPDGEAHFGDLLQQGEYTTTKAQSAKDNELCPECDSPNYIAPKGVPNAMKQCFNCGFNPRFAHSTAGASGIGQKNMAPPRPARAQTLSEGNFNPGTIIGRVQ